MCVECGLSDFERFSRSFWSIPVGLVEIRDAQRHARSNSIPRISTVIPPPFHAGLEELHGMAWNGVTQIPSDPAELWRIGIAILNWNWSGVAWAVEGIGMAWRGLHNAFRIAWNCIELN